MWETECGSRGPKVPEQNWPPAVGPGLVVDQKGANSYKVEIERDRFLEVPTKFLKPFLEDAEFGPGTPLFWYKRTEDDF